MSNLAIIKTNSINSTLTLTATSEATGHLISEVQDDIKIDTWRSTGLAAQTITATWTDAQLIAGVALPFNNLIAGSTVQIKLYTNVADGSPVLDVGVQNVDFAYDIPSGFTTIGAVSFAFGGGNYFSSFFAEQSVKKMEVIINSTSNPDGYMELSRVVAGQILRPANNAEYGASIGFLDATRSVTTDAGNIVSDRGNIRRSVDFSFDLMDAADKSEITKLFRTHGKAIPLFISFLPDNSVDESESSGQIYGRINNDMSISLPSFNTFSLSLAIQEI